MCHPLQLVISRNLLWPLLPPCSEIETERASARVGAFARKGKINPFHRVQALSKLSLWLAGPSFSSEVWSSPFPRGASFPPSSPGFPVCCPRSSLLLAFAGLPFSSQLGLSLFRWLRPPPLCSTPHASLFLFLLSGPAPVPLPGALAGPPSGAPASPFPWHVLRRLVAG